jgi:predicted methyltransferase
MTETSVPDDQKRRVVAGYSAMAETYDTRRSMQICVRRLVALAAIPPGAQVLDVATGTGWAALAAAEHVGPTGKVPNAPYRGDSRRVARRPSHIPRRTKACRRLLIALYLY